MPKLKTHRGAAKRFKLTASGKLKRRKAFDSHLLSKKSAKRKRGLEKEVTVGKTEAKRVKRILGV